MSKQNMQRKLYFVVSVSLMLVLSIGLVRLAYAAIDRVPIRKYLEPAQANSVWDWQNAANRSAQDMQDTALFLYRHQISLVFLDISNVVETSPQDVEAADKAYAAYVKAMAKRNIQVLAAGGHTDWSKPSERWRPEKLLDYVYAYNQRHPEAAFAGIELDIEAYNQQGFSEATMSEKGRVLLEFMDTVDQLAKKHQQQHAHLALGFAIPYWFDNENKNIPVITWRYRTGPILYHLADRLNELPNTNLVVMAYRNASRGNDGTITHAQTEVQYAAYKAPKVKILIGQETTKVEPAKITFYGLTMPEFSREVKLLAESFQIHHSYGGIAINDLSGLEALAAVDVGVDLLGQE